MRQGRDRRVIAAPPGSPLIGSVATIN
jgi:hypothetical protein